MDGLQESGVTKSKTETETYQICAMPQRQYRCTCFGLASLLALGHCQTAKQIHNFKNKMLGLCIHSTPSLCAYNVGVLELSPRQRQIDHHRVRIKTARTDNHNQTNNALAHMSNMACARALVHMACQFTRNTQNNATTN